MTERKQRKRRTKPGLSEAEKRAFERIKRKGVLLVSPRYRPTNAIKSLIEKNLIRELPGLFADAPQGYATTE